MVRKKSEIVDVLDLARKVQAAFEKKKWRFAFIGGIAIQQWGEPRVTRDIDLTLLTNFHRDTDYIDEVLELFPGRTANAKQHAISQRVILAQGGNIGIDIALGGMSFENDVIDRSVMRKYTPGVILRTCTADDLVVFKAFADREKDWGDLKGVLMRQQQLDWPYIFRQLSVLAELKEQPELVDKLRAFRDRLAAQEP